MTSQQARMWYFVMFYNNGTWQLVTRSVVSGWRNFSESCDQCTSTYCFSSRDASCRTSTATDVSTVNSAKNTPNSKTHSQIYF